MTKGVGNTNREQAKRNFKKVNPDNNRFCGMCGSVVPTERDNLTQFTSSKVSNKFWMVHVSWACSVCNCTTSMAYTTEVDPEPIQDAIKLYAP